MRVSVRIFLLKAVTKWKIFLAFHIYLNLWNKFLSFYELKPLKGTSFGRKLLVEDIIASKLE